jgi:hypothetical protein
MRLEEIQIGRFLHLRFEIRDRKLDVQFQISNLELEVQESSNFKFPRPIRNSAYFVLFVAVGVLTI